MSKHEQTYTDDEYAEVIRKSYKQPRRKLAVGGIVNGGEIVINGGSPPNFPPTSSALAAAIVQRQGRLRNPY